MDTTAATARSPVDEPILRRLKGELERLYGDRLERVLLFGSRARGDARPDSDWDVAAEPMEASDERVDSRSLRNRPREQPDEQRADAGAGHGAGP
jgi:predicted nucleotidyltransferase